MPGIIRYSVLDVKKITEYSDFECSVKKRDQESWKTDVNIPLLWEDKGNRMKLKDSQG